MNLRKIDLNLLTVFDAVMREGNFTRAAQNIGMSQPAVSDAVSRLRYLLKDDLFVRTGHGVRPTTRAKNYSEQVRRILDLVVMMLSESLTFDYVTSDRSFNLVLGDYGELVVLPRLMQWLDDMEANVTINVRSVHQHQLSDALGSGEIDLFLTPEPIRNPGFVSKLVVVESLMSMVRSDHPLIKDSLSLDQFLSLRHVTIEWFESRGSIVEQYLRAQGFERKRHAQVHSFFDMPRVVASTDMVCSVPSQMAHHFAATHKLKSLPIPLPGLKIPFYLNWHKNFESDDGATWIRNAIAEFLAS